MDQDTPRVESKAALYAELAARLTGLIADQTDFIANSANFAALLFTTLPQLNWVGFYRLHGNDLVLGPFQGRPARSRITLGDGVCASAALQRAVVLVPDVRAFAGHISCDEASQSEMALPFFKDARLIGVLDLDSPVRHRFDTIDSEHIRQLLQLLMAGTVVPESWLAPVTAMAPGQSGRLADPSAGDRSQSPRSDERAANAGEADRRRSSPPGEDAGTLTDEEYLAAGGPDAIDSATTEDPPAPRRNNERNDAGNPERAGSAAGRRPKP